MTVLRIDPFRDLDRLADQVWGRPRSVPPMDAYRRADEVVVQFDLPGVDPASIDVTVERGRLTVTGDRRPLDVAGDEIVVRERPTGRFTRQLRLADGLDVSRVQADYELGVLTVTLPKHEEGRPRRIEVSHTGDAVGVADAVGDGAAPISPPGAGDRDPRGRDPGRLIDAGPSGVGDSDPPPVAVPHGPGSGRGRGAPAPGRAPPERWQTAGRRPDRPARGPTRPGSSTVERPPCKRLIGVQFPSWARRLGPGPDPARRVRATGRAGSATPRLPEPVRHHPAGPRSPGRQRRRERPVKDFASSSCGPT